MGFKAPAWSVNVNLTMQARGRITFQMGFDYAAGTRYHCVALVAHISIAIYLKRLLNFIVSR